MFVLVPRVDHQQHKYEETDDEREIYRQVVGEAHVDEDIVEVDGVWHHEHPGPEAREMSRVAYRYFVVG